MKITKTEIRLKTGFQQPKTGLPKTPVLTSLLKKCYVINKYVTIKHSFYYFFFFFFWQLFLVFHFDILSDLI